MNIDEIERPEPHPAKVLLEKHGVPLWRTAKYLGVSYFHASKVLSGHVALSRKLELKLDELVEDLNKREG